MSNFDGSVFSKAMIAIRSRAERLDNDQIIDSFSTVGPLVDLISSEDHQVIFGRRGTGKTHALRYLYSTVIDKGDIAVFVDMLNLGSDTSIYNDVKLSVAERSTRLLIDVLSHIQEGILDYATSGVNLNFEKLSSLLDALNDATSQVRVNGNTKVTSETTQTDNLEKQASTSAEVGTGGGILARIGLGAKKTSEKGFKWTSTTIGGEVYSARFPQLGTAVRDLVQFFPNGRVWLIMDEWSSLPPELQPFLADLLKRTFFNVQKVTVKIGAVEHRTKLLLEQSNGDRLGLEATADIRTDVRLDDYLLFDNDKETSVNFFKDFLFRHIKNICKERDMPEPSSPEQILGIGFSQRNAFEEFVNPRYSSGPVFWPAEDRMRCFTGG